MIEKAYLRFIPSAMREKLAAVIESAGVLESARPLKSAIVVGQQEGNPSRL
jgi:hypothetical protein